MPQQDRISESELMVAEVIRKMQKSWEDEDFKEKYKLFSQVFYCKSSYKPDLLTELTYYLQQRAEFTDTEIVRIYRYFILDHILI